MFCPMCGAKSDLDVAKFCAECGAQLAAPASNDGTGAPAEESIELARRAIQGTDAESTLATESIIESSDTKAMLSCIDLADDSETIESWYSELITAESISTADRGKFLLQFVGDYLVGKQRYSEAEFLVEGLLSWDPHFEREAQEVSQMLRKKSMEQGTRFELNSSWDNETYRGPLLPDFVGQKLFEFFLYRLVYSDSEKNEFYRTLMIPDPNSIYQDFYGYYLGLQSNDILNNEIFWHASVTHLQVLRKRLAMPSNSFKYLASRVLESKLPPKFSKDALTNFNNKSNLCERIYAILLTSEKIGDTTDINQGYLILTNDRIYLYKQSGMLSEGYAKSFWKDDMQSLELGDSAHEQLSGFTSRSTEWVTISIFAENTGTVRRHFYLGHNAAEISSNTNLIQKTIRDAAGLGYPVADGEGIYSQEGYRLSMGFGIITPMD